MSAQTRPTRSADQAQVRGVLAKLALFSVLLALGPIATYYGINWYLTKDTNMAAIGAIVVANLVLVGYILVAINEDKQDQQAAQQAKEKLSDPKTQ